MTFLLSLALLTSPNSQLNPSIKYAFLIPKLKIFTQLDFLNEKKLDCCLRYISASFNLQV